MIVDILKIEIGIIIYLFLTLLVTYVYTYLQMSDHGSVERKNQLKIVFAWPVIIPAYTLYTIFINVFIVFPIILSKKILDWKTKFIHWKTKRAMEKMSEEKAKEKTVKKK